MHVWKSLYTSKALSILNLPPIDAISFPYKEACGVVSTGFVQDLQATLQQMELPDKTVTAT